MTLSENDKALIALSLRIAAMQFAADSITAQPLASAFNQQNRDAVRLAELFEDADVVEVRQ